MTKVHVISKDELVLERGHPVPVGVVNGDGPGNGNDVYRVQRATVAGGVVYVTWYDPTYIPPLDHRIIFLQSTRSLILEKIPIIEAFDAPVALSLGVGPGVLFLQVVGLKARSAEKGGLSRLPDPQDERGSVL